ncbi:MAG TPA: hypothetical protein VFN67_13940 [Polyangiales bacterium]|jgi:hypothetical protein|nr:hypothetical protein [Polyangiales bacterium]
MWDALVGDAKAGPFASLGANAEISSGDGWYSRLGVALENHWLRMIDGAGATTEPRSAFVLRTTLGAGKQF